MLGSAEVRTAGRVRIKIPDYEGSIDQLTIVVRDGIVAIDKLVVRVGKKKATSKLDTTLGPGDHYTVDIDTAKATLNRVVVDVSDVSDQPTIEVYGRDWTWTVTRVDGGIDAWTSLGKQSVQGTGTATFSASSTPAERLAVRIDGADLAQAEVRIEGNGGVRTTTLRDRADGMYAIVRTRANGITTVTDVTVDYELEGTDEATLEILVEPPWIQFATAQPVARGSVRRDGDVGTWSAEGWTLLGEDEVDLIDDYVEIGKKKSTWDEVALVADGDAIHVEAVELTLGGKKPRVQREELAKELDGDSRVRVIEIAGGRRTVSKVRLQYKKHRLDASTRVQIYAR